MLSWWTRPPLPGSPGVQLWILLGSESCSHKAWWKRQQEKTDEKAVFRAWIPRFHPAKPHWRRLSQCLESSSRLLRLRGTTCFPEASWWMTAKVLWDTAQQRSINRHRQHRRTEVKGKGIQISFFTLHDKSRPAYPRGRPTAVNFIYWKALQVLVGHKAHSPCTHIPMKKDHNLALW